MEPLYPDPHEPHIEWSLRTATGDRCYGFIGASGPVGPWRIYDPANPIVAAEGFWSVPMSTDLSSTPERIALWIALRLAP